MPSERTSAGDPARTLKLLWREPDTDDSRHGPRQGLSVERVVAASLALADAQGLGAVTMRRNYALEDAELTAGYVLTCQAIPSTDAVTVDYDA